MSASVVTAIAVSAATSASTRALEDSQDTNWGIRIEQCKALDTKKETYACLQQLQIDKSKSDHDMLVDSAIIVSIVVSFMIAFFIWAYNC